MRIPQMKEAAILDWHKRPASGRFRVACGGWNNHRDDVGNLGFATINLTSGTITMGTRANGAEPGPLRNM